MKLQNIVFIKDIILNSDPRFFNQDLFKQSVQAIINSKGLCIDPPVLSRVGGDHSTKYDVESGVFQVLCAKEAAKRAGIDQLNCYIAENERELDELMNQVYAFRYK